MPGAAGYVVARTRVPYIRDEYSRLTPATLSSRLEAGASTANRGGRHSPLEPRWMWAGWRRPCPTCSGCIRCAASSAENPESALAGRTLEHGWHLEDAVEAIGTVMDTSEIAGLPDGDQPAYIFCWTLPENARCANVGPTTLTL